LIEEKLKTRKIPQGQGGPGDEKIQTAPPGEEEAPKRGSFSQRNRKISDRPPDLARPNKGKKNTRPLERKGKGQRKTAPSAKEKDHFRATWGGVCGARKAQRRKNPPFFSYVKGEGGVGGKGVIRGLL